jgi:hypothetical protein
VVQTDRILARLLDVDQDDASLHGLACGVGRHSSLGVMLQALDEERQQPGNVLWPLVGGHGDAVGDAQ